MNRKAGVILPIFSLPSEYGIGDLGAEAYQFVDFLSAAGQSVWQVLPLNPTSAGNSPYSGFSAFAGNELLQSFDPFIEEGIISREQLNSENWGSSVSRVDYGKIIPVKSYILRKAGSAYYSLHSNEIERFAEENGYWLPDYCLFRALKQHFGEVSWDKWPEDIRFRKPEALEKYSGLLREDICSYRALQYVFFRQLSSLKEYMNGKGISFMGDLPFYVSYDSADVWAHSSNFQLDKDKLPTAVAGVPPDYFSKDGQLWNNPLYNWDYLKGNDYYWWVNRIECAARCFDLMRLDHFRGFESYWSVPAGEKTAINGKWVKGPGLEFIELLKKKAGNMKFIAEDLGILTDDVRKLLSDSKLPGMKVLQFAYSPDGSSDYLPHRHHADCVCYGGTHDNNTIQGWLDEAKENEIAFVKAYTMPSNAVTLCDRVLDSGLNSAAFLFITQFQDYLGLDVNGRINVPGVPEGNWGWRMTPEMISWETAHKMRKMALEANRGL